MRSTTLEFFSKTKIHSQLKKKKTIAKSKGKEYKQLRRHKIKSSQAENQEDSSFPADGHQALLNNEQKVKD